MTGGSKKQIRLKSVKSNSNRTDRYQRSPVVVGSHTREYDSALAAIRSVARNRGWIDRDVFLRDLAFQLGHQRLGSQIRNRLKNSVRTALRRKILESDGTNLRLFATNVDDYSYDYLRAVLMSVTRPCTVYNRETLYRSIVDHLGFRRLTQDTLRVLKSILNSAIRRGMVERVGDQIRRCS